jgi:hypothetical protein
MKAPPKNRGGRPKVGSVFVGVRVPPAELAELDAWRAKQDPKPSRPLALRRLAKIAMDSEAKRKR